MSRGVVVLEPCAVQQDPGYWTAGSAPVGVVPLAEPLCLLPWVESERPTSLVVLARAQAARQAREAVTVLTGHRPDLPVSLLVRRTTGLMLALAGAEGLAQGADDNHTVGLIDRAVESATTGAWLKAVRGLSEPRASTWQRMRSLLPGRGFVATLGTDPSVCSAGAFEGLPNPTIVGAEANSAPSNRALQVLGSGNDSAMAAVVDGRRAYGSSAVEFVSWAGLDRTLPTVGVCRVCRLRVATPICTYCNVYSTPEGARV